MARINITAAAADSLAIPPAFLERLFFAVGSGVHERHLLLAGFVQSAEFDPSVLKRLLPLVGRYEDARRQRVLERFAEGCRVSYFPEQPLA